ncbi:MAG: glutaredoxin [Candidatus Aminicenantes bacterium]|nr:glutaredoxin [Candidatus Aminicenantes bacterium]
MDFVVFTLPGCSKCDKLKELMKSRGIKAKEFDVSTKEGKAKIRDYIKLLRRDSSGSIIIPTLIIEEKGMATAVLNSAEELDLWLKSRV